MLAAQKCYFDGVNEISNVLQSIDLSQELDLKLKDLASKLTNAQIIVPVVGAFSAGKSFLINSFLGRDVLGVKLTPETSLATELHFAPREKIEAITSEGRTEEYEVAEFDIRKLDTQRYQFLRYFLDNDRLKGVAPLVLVDMPGFDSPLDAHNKAIMNYLDLGSHFIVLVSVEDGTLPRSVLRQLIDLHTLGHTFTFCLSKTDLRAPTVVQEVGSEISRQLGEYLGASDDLVYLDKQEGGNKLAEIIRKIDPEVIFKRLFREEIMALVNDALGAINSRIAALGNEQAGNMKIIEELTNRIAAVQRKSEEMQADIQDRANEFNTNLVTNTLGRELSSIVDELVARILKGEQDGAEQLINDTIRSCLLRQLHEFIRETGDKAIEGFDIELGNIKQTLENSGILPELAGKISDLLANKLDSFTDGIKKSLNTYANKRSSGDQKGNGGWLITVTKYASIAISILQPVLRAVIPFLPAVLEFLFAERTKQRQREAVRQRLLSEVFPAIKAKLRKELPGFVNDQVAELIRNIGRNMNEKLATVQAQFAKGEEERQHNIAELKQKLERYEQARCQISALGQAIAAC